MLTLFHALSASKLPSSRVKRSQDDPTEEGETESRGYDDSSGDGYARDDLDDDDDDDDDDDPKSEGGWW